MMTTIADTLATLALTTTIFPGDEDTCPTGERVPDNGGVPPIPPEYLAMLPSPVPAPTYPTWEIALKVTTYSLTMALGIVGNALVILIVWLNPRMQTATNLYVANLAGSDLMVSAFCMWVHMGNQITAEWPFGPVVCRMSSFIQGERMHMTLSANPVQ